MKTGFYKIVDAEKAELMTRIHANGSVVEIVGIDEFGWGVDKYDRVIVDQQDLDNGSIVYLGEIEPSKPDFEEFKSRCDKWFARVSPSDLKMIYNEVVIGTDWE